MAGERPSLYLGRSQCQELLDDLERLRTTHTEEQGRGADRLRAALEGCGLPGGHKGPCGIPTMLTIAGKRFTCQCGANVFTKAGAEYRCNGCDRVYAAGGFEE